MIGSGVNAGSYELTLDPEKIKIVDANNKDVSEMYARTILPGKLIINKRSVLITSQSATKTYDGSALTRPAVTITGDGFVPGELAKAEATGSITKVGSTPNAIQYTTTGAFNAANYSIALSVGTLTVTEAEAGTAAHVQPDDQLRLSERQARGGFLQPRRPEERRNV